MTWTVDVKEDEKGDQYIILPDGVLDQAGWQEGDELEWIRIDNDTYELRSMREYVLVDAIEITKVQYVVATPVGKESWALDSVVCGDANEVYRKKIDEVVTGHQMIREDRLAKFKHSSLSMAEFKKEYVLDLTDDNDPNKQFS